MPRRKGHSQISLNRKRGGRRQDLRPVRNSKTRKSVVRTSNYKGPRAEQQGYQHSGSGKLHFNENSVKESSLSARQARKERNRKELKEQAASRVSYVRKPFARRSRMSIFLAAAAFALGCVGIREAVTTQGQAPLSYAAMGFCSIFLAVIAIWYGGISFLEKEKNYILAKFGIACSLLLLAGWATIITIGLGG